MHPIPREQFLLGLSLVLLAGRFTSGDFLLSLSVRFVYLAQT